MVLKSHKHFASVEILRNYLCQMKMENELMFITVNIKDVIIDLMVETKKTNNTTEKTKNM
jgi:UDP-N-acetylglucosamine 2-epimerase